MINHNRNIASNLSRTLLCTCIAITISACSFQQYAAKPIDQIASIERFQQKDPASASFQQYLVSNGYPEKNLPLQQWNADDLTLCALFFHPSLDVARAQWRLAEQAEARAAERPIASLSGHFANSNQANSDNSPYAFGLSIDIPIETANKRDIRIENARHLSLAAKLEVAQTAWQLRKDVVQSLNDYQFNQQQINLLTKEEARRGEIAAIYQKRVDLGAASNVELSTAKLLLQTVTSELNAKKYNRLVLRAKLATSTGLPLAKIEAMHFIFDADNQKQADYPPAGNLQTTALLNRLDIRIALERYAVSEAKLKLEIAKQYPNIIISPGYAYEFGDSIWSLGLSGLLTILNKNKLAIAEATQLREVEATQFEALQSRTIAQADTANVELIRAKQALDNQQKLREQQLLNTQRSERKFKAGEIDRLGLAFSQLENINADKSVALSQFQLKNAQNQLENALQIPLSAVNSTSENQKKNIIKLEDLSLKEPKNKTIE